MKILVGIPCGEDIRAKMAFSLLQLKGDHTVTMQIGCDVAHNRNKLVAQAEDYDYLMMIDSDMKFNPDTLERMIAHDKDILGLACNHRQLPLESVVKPLIEGQTTLPTELFEAESVGTGVILIKTEVFNKIDAPWFEFTYDGERIGEDVNFCRKARAAGYKIWVDPTIPVKHLGSYEY